MRVGTDLEPAQRALDLVEPGRTVGDSAASLGIAGSCPHRWGTGGWWGDSRAIWSRICVPVFVLGIMRRSGCCSTRTPARSTTWASGWAPGHHLRDGTATRAADLGVGFESVRHRPAARVWARHAADLQYRTTSTARTRVTSTTRATGSCKACPPARVPCSASSSASCGGSSHARGKPSLRSAT